MGMWIGGTAVKKAWIGGTEVKKAWIGGALAWQSTKPTETGSWKVGDYTADWGSSKFQTKVTVTVTEKNYGANSMKITVQVQIGSISNYYISSTATKTGTVGINGTNYTTSSYNSTISANSFKTIGTFTGISVSGASGKTIAITTSLPINVTVTGVGTINTVTSSHNVTLPTLS